MSKKSSKKENINVSVGELLEQSSKIITFKGRAVRKNPPKEVKIGREFLTKQRNFEKELFSQIEEKQETGIEGGCYTISGVSKKITETLYNQIFFALGQALSNDSYRYGHDKEHTGTSVGGVMETVTIPPTIVNGKAYHYASIRTSDRELAKFAFGTDNPTTKQILKIRTALYSLQNDGVTLTAPDGTVYNKSLAWVEGRTERKYKTDMIEYSLVLNPIFAMNASKNFARHPQDANKRLSDSAKQVTLYHYRLRDLLAMQKITDEPFRRYASQLLEDLGLTEEYKKNKKRVIEEKLPKLFNSMIDIKLITKMPEKVIGANGEYQFLFSLNKDYVKPIKEKKEHKK